mmetsp:Transcript_29559/g.78240  ORF Transcript_29559/g.78240 Transcript_29559/m.78240 type:complete len:198 (+) Transcript_29559:81-674(+)
MGCGASATHRYAESTAEAEGRSLRISVVLQEGGEIVLDADLTASDEVRILRLKVEEKLGSGNTCTLFIPKVDQELCDEDIIGFVLPDGGLLHAAVVGAAAVVADAAASKLVEPKRDQEAAKLAAIAVKEEDEELVHLFQAADRNGNGSISKKELKDLMSAIHQVSDDDVEEMLKAVDIDHDGLISFAEFKEMARSLA